MHGKRVYWQPPVDRPFQEKPLWVIMVGAMPALTKNLRKTWGNFVQVSWVMFETLCSSFITNLKSQKIQYLSSGVILSG